ncbi:hypothetical protein KKB06_02295, partial [Patescibacteria group bacterium]|nr:hypothetical protein [Patescibacteria group bacterium]
MRFIKVVFFILVLGAGLLWAKEARADYCGKTCVCGNYDCDCFGATEASCKAVCQDPSESVTEDNCEWVLSCGNLNQPCCFNDSCNGALVCYSGICKNACTDKCTNSEPLQCRNGDIQSNNCDKSGDCNEWDGWVTNTDCGEGFCTYDASGNPICQIPYCENGDCNDAACRDSDGGCDISEMCVECYTNSTKSNWMYDTCEFMYDCEDYEGECHPIETWCGGDASCPPASGPSANTQATIDNCGGVDCEDPASIDCGGNPGNPGCTENWQEQGCEACGCASDQMCLRDENDCGGADQCNYDASCLINPPTCSMTAGDLKPMINQSYNYTATGNAGGGNLTFLKLFETVAIDPPVFNQLTGSPCTTGSCTASKFWDSLGYKYVMCNAFNDTLPENAVNSQCTGNPYKTVFDTWSDCDVADSDQMTVAVVD